MKPRTNRQHFIRNVHDKYFVSLLVIAHQVTHHMVRLNYLFHVNVYIKLAGLFRPANIIIMTLRSTDTCQRHSVQSALPKRSTIITFDDFTFT